MTLRALRLLYRLLLEGELTAHDHATRDVVEGASMDGAVLAEVQPWTRLQRHRCQLLIDEHLLRVAGPECTFLRVRPAVVSIASCVCWLLLTWREILPFLNFLYGLQQLLLLLLTKVQIACFIALVVSLERILHLLRLRGALTDNDAAV